MEASKNLWNQKRVEFKNEMNEAIVEIDSLQNQSAADSRLCTRFSKGKKYEKIQVQKFYETAEW